jgi:hypothetical protein
MGGLERKNAPVALRCAAGAPRDVRADRVPVWAMLKYLESEAVLKTVLALKDRAKPLCL